MVGSGSWKTPGDRPRCRAGWAPRRRRTAEAALVMQASVTVPMSAPADTIWNLVADVRNTGRFSPETFEAEWLDGVTGPALGARFRGHVKRNEIGPVYWTTCRVTACEPGREFGFEVLVGDTPVNNWHYLFTPVDGGTEVTESFPPQGIGADQGVLGVRRLPAPPATSATCEKRSSGSRPSSRGRTVTGRHSRSKLKSPQAADAVVDRRRETSAPCANASNACGHPG